MYLIQCFLPLYDNAKKRFPRSAYDAEREVLTKRFGGLTGYTQAPLEGLWNNDDTGLTRDDLIIYEVMAEDLDRSWWKSYRRELEQRFRQDHIVLRAQVIELL